MNNTGIIWTEATWNPMSGCQKVSQGCKYCYAETIAEQKRGTRAFPNGFDLTIRSHKLIEPFKLKEPCLIFVNSMSDLFWDKVPNDYRNKIVDVIEQTPQHEYQILTKRPDLMLQYSKYRKLPPNFWAGTTVENEAAMFRIKLLKQVDAEIKFISMEPLLSALYLQDGDLETISWVITGGESGVHLWKGNICEERALVRYNSSNKKWEAREDRIKWVRDIKDFCGAHNVKFFHKQWGGTYPKSAGRLLDGKNWDEIPRLPGSRVKIKNDYLDFIESKDPGKNKSGDQENETLEIHISDQTKHNYLKKIKMNDELNGSNEPKKIVDQDREWVTTKNGDILLDNGHPEEIIAFSKSYENIDEAKEEIEQKNEKITNKSLVVPFSKMSEVVMKLPKRKFIWGNIPDGGSVGIILGATGSGKSILSENIAMTLLSGAEEFLGLPINFDKDQTILSIGLEEGQVPRTQRQIEQSKRICQKVGESWKDRWFVITDEVSDYLTTDQDFKMIKDLIKKTNAKIVFLDSLTHLYEGMIEDSMVAKRLMKKLRSLAKETKATIIVIHHTPKIYNYQMSNNSAAGSRVIAQELDFMFGINEASNGKKYIKMLKSRYCANTNKVRVVSISNDCWFELDKVMDEQELLIESDGRFDSSNKDKIYAFISEKCQTNEDVVEVSELKEAFESSGEMTSVTIFSGLKSLIKEKKIVKLDHGKYGKQSAA